MTTTFPTPDPVRARIVIELGDITVAVGSSAETLVDVVPTDPARDVDRTAADQTRVTCTDGRLEVLGPRHSALIGPTRKSGSVRVRVTLPAGSAVEARTSLGAIATDGPLGEVAAKTGAGDVLVDVATTADLSSGVGAVTAGNVDGDLRCSTGSGPIRVDRVGCTALVKNSNGDTWIGEAGTSTRVKAANGRVTVELARGDVNATTANGSLRVGCAQSGSVQLRTSLGSIELGIPYGTAARLGLRTSHGRVRSELDQAAGPVEGERTLEVDAQTSAGDIDVVRAVLDEADAAGGRR
jgi:DUF4097 and DUF4098 domain-containing protein YvlB